MAPVLPTINLGPKTTVNMGDVFTPVGISQAEYASRPVNFYGEGLDTSIDVDTISEKEDQSAEKTISPNIYGGDDGGDDTAGVGQIISGPNAGKSVLQGAFANTKMYGVTDINLNSAALKDTDLTKSPFSNFFDVATGELGNVAKATKAAGLGTPTAESIIKGRSSAVGVPGAMAPIMAAAGPIGGLMALSTAAARTVQARDAASIMAANGKAGAMFDFNGMLLTRSPGSFQYTGNLQGYTPEQIKSIEAVKRGFIPGTFTETKVGDQWVQNGKRFGFGYNTDNVVANGGMYDPETGGFIGLDGSRAAGGTMAMAEDYVNSLNARYGSNLHPSVVAATRAQVERVGLFGLGGIKPGTKTFEQRMIDLAKSQGDAKKAARDFAAKVDKQYAGGGEDDFGFTEADTKEARDDEAGDVGISSSPDSYDQPSDVGTEGDDNYEDYDESFAFGGSVDDDASDDEMGDVATMESSYSADPDAFADEDAGMYDSSEGGNDDNTIEAVRQNIMSAIDARNPNTLSKTDRQQLSEQMSVLGSRDKFNEAVKKEMDRFKSTEYKPPTIDEINKERADIIGGYAKDSLRDIITNAPLIAAQGMALGPMVLARELGITGRVDEALGVSKSLGLEPDQPMIGTDVLTRMGFGQFVNPFKADGGRVGYAPGGDVGFSQRPEFVGGRGSQPDGVSVADDQPRDVQEGSFVINAAAADFAGRDDIEKMIRTAYKKVGNIGQTGQSQEVAINVSKGEVIIPAAIAKVIGYDRLNKINNRGKKEIARRQEKVEAAGGGFIQRKKFAEGDRVTLYRGEPLDPTKIVATDYGYGKEDVGKFHTPDVKRAGRFAAGAGKGNQVIKSRKVTIDELFDGVEEAWKTQAKKKTDYFAKMPKSELNKNLRFVKELRRAYLAGERSLDSMAMFLQEQVFHDDKSKINFIETFKNDPKSAGKLAGRALTKVATKAAPPLAILGVAAEIFTPSQLGKSTLYDDSFMDYQLTK